MPGTFILGNPTPDVPLSQWMMSLSSFMRMRCSLTKNSGVWSFLLPPAAAFPLPVARVSSASPAPLLLRLALTVLVAEAAPPLLGRGLAFWLLAEALVVVVVAWPVLVPTGRGVVVLVVVGLPPPPATLFPPGIVAGAIRTSFSSAGVDTAAVARRWR